MRKLFLVFILLVLALPVAAMEIAGITIEEKITTAEGVDLQLNGAGVRKKLFFKIYIAGLFLDTQTEDATAVIKNEGAKRVVMHFLYDKVEKEKLVSSWNEGFIANVEASDLAGLQSRIDTFNALFNEDALAGDVITFDYIPGRGTSVTIKGKDRGLIEGKDFNDALLSIWLGKKPVSSDLKKAMLHR